MSGIIYNTYIADYYLDKLSNEINFSEARKNNPEFVFLDKMVKKILILEYDNSINPFKPRNLAILVDEDMHILIYDTSQKIKDANVKKLLSVFYTKENIKKYDFFTIDHVMLYGKFTKIRDSDWCKIAHKK